MPDRPILFSAPMVHALLAGRKTQTRRALDLACEAPPAFVEDGAVMARDENERLYRWPRTPAVGDRLWVREAWRAELSWQSLRPADIPHEAAIFFECDGSQRDNGLGAKFRGRLRASMHMPRWASRITLVVTEVRVQRLQDISAADAEAEGVFRHVAEYSLDKVFRDDRGETARRYFRELWDSLNAVRGYGWDANPWVVAVTFAVRRGNIDQLPAAEEALP